jgi:hypothetical protein
MDSIELKNALENSKNEYLLKYTLQKINDIKLHVINELPILQKNKNSLKKKLKDYKYVIDLEELKEGSFIRWITQKNEDYYLTNGGFIVEVIFTENGILLLIKGINNSFFKIVFDHCIIFQKLNNQENILLLTLDYLEKS